MEFDGGSASSSSVYSFGSEDDDMCWEHEPTAANDFGGQGHRCGSRLKPFEVHFTCLSFPEGVQEQICRSLNDARELTALDEAEASLLQRHYRWQLADLSEQWFADSSKVCRAVGITSASSEGTCPSNSTQTGTGVASSSDASPTPSTTTSPSAAAGSTASIPASPYCPVCYERISSEPPGSGGEIGQIFFGTNEDEENIVASYALPCGHRFCEGCWKGFLENSVSEGPLCLQLKCMFPKCTLAVRWKMFAKFCSPEVNKRFEEFMRRNFVENNPCCKWCPEPDCPNAILVKEPVQTIEMQGGRFNGASRPSGTGSAAIAASSGSGFSTSSKEVVCQCGWRWCFVCNEEAHRGISCLTVKKWVEKNQDEAENVAWILANTKPCPKCKNPIEKNQGCMHMVCRCGHQFCWLCSADDYNYSHTRDGRPCNKYLEAPDLEKETSQRNLARYAHYFERYRSHHHAQKMASHKTLRDIRGTMEELQKQTGSWMDVTFLEDAIQQVIDCRRMLKWTYAHGYFATHQTQKREFFEFQQGQLEQKVDQLQAEFEKFDTTAGGASQTSQKQQCTENSRVAGESFQENPMKEEDKFYELKFNLTNLTKVVDTFFTNLSEFFENTSHTETIESKAKADSEVNSAKGTANQLVTTTTTTTTTAQARTVIVPPGNAFGNTTLIGAPPQRNLGYPNHRPPGPRR